MSTLEATSGVRTIAITLSKQCPSVEPIDGPVCHEGETFSPAALSIVGAAIDAGLFYTDDVKAFCRDRWLAEFPATDTCLTAKGDVTYERAAEPFAERRAQLVALDARLAQAPRGTWFLLRQDWKSSEGHSGTTWTLHVADGAGGAHSVQTGPIWHNEGRAPNFADALQSMVGMEIYLATNAERWRRETARSRALVAARAWAVGTKLRNLKVGAKAFSSGVITDINTTGYLTLELTKRGSRKRMSWTGLAQAVRADGIDETVPGYGQVITRAA